MRSGTSFDGSIRGQSIRKKTPKFEEPANDPASELLHLVPNEMSRTPSAKPLSPMVYYMPDSEAEAANDVDINGRANSPSNQIIGVAKRTLALVTFYLGQTRAVTMQQKNTNSWLTSPTLSIRPTDKRKG